ncbi:MAG: hypothetical protein ACNA71_01580 [Kiritimatiellia bacterium]
METISYDLAESLIRSLGMIITNSHVYGLQHGVTRNAIDACFQHVGMIFRAGDAAVSMSEDDLTVNGVAIEQKNPLIKSFVAHLEKQDITNFTLRSGMTREQFEAFKEILLAPAGDLQQLGGFAGAIAAIGLSDVVTTKKVTYVEVAEDEVVVDKDAVVEPNTALAAEKLQEKVDRAKAYLCGDAGAQEEAAAACVRELSADAGSLSDLICDAVQAQIGNGEALTKEIIAMLQRVYDALTRDPTFHTQKTKKQIHKTLALLEKEISGKLAADPSSSHGDAEDLAQIKDAIETMEDALTIDVLSQEYVKRRGAIDSSEKRILRFMKNKTVDMIEESDLKSRLIASGLSPEDWYALLAKSGVTGLALPVGADRGGTVDVAAEVDAPVVGQLDTLIKRVAAEIGVGAADTGLPFETQGALPESGGGRCAVMLRVPEEVLQHDLHAVQQEVNRIILHAEKRIEKLIREVEGDDAGGKRDRAHKPVLSQQRLFEILAELGQELCQPLAVINCSVDALLSGMIGEISDVQRKMLALSADSSSKLKGLIDKLIAIAGVPESRNVDKAIQASLYQ